MSKNLLKIENLETANRVKNRYCNAAVWKTFSENKTFHECLFDVLYERSVQVLNLLNAGSIKKKVQNFFIGKSHHTAPFILFDVIF